ncbi:MAG TPA: DUF6798 domain-containing protein [Gemmatimonadales bacterium]|nr:DUF6798 domain-containing protein [Gemmatimonadales bacterium]
MTRRWIWLIPLSTAALLSAGHALQRFFWITAPSPDAAWWLVSLLLASVFALAGFSLMRSLGVEGALLPVALAIAATGAGGPLTARTADGPTGAGFGMEALALGLLVWAYDAFARDRPIRLGVLLGGAGLAHPLVFLQGLIVLLVAALFVRHRGWRRTGQAVLIALAVGAPAALQLAIGAFDILRMGPAEGQKLIWEGYRFRFANSYALQGLIGATGLSRLLLVVGGFAGVSALARTARAPGARAMLGLLAGHTGLVLLAVLCYTSPLPGPWRRSVAAHAADLTLTTPLLQVLAAIALAAPLEASLLARPRRLPAPTLLGAMLAAATVTLLISLRWDVWLALAIAIGILILVVVATGRGAGVAALALAATLVVELGSSYRRSVRPTTVDPEDEALYQWARATPKRSLFIVPPTARNFRYYTRKGVVVDYDLVPPADPRGLRAWRDRLDLVANPDARLRRYPAWRRPYAMDRGYAVANTPTRAAMLLRHFGVQYLVWDARGLEIPPFLPIDRPADPAVTEVFRNSRYVVYALEQPESVVP